MTLEVVGAVGVLAVAGALPTLAVVGLRPVSLPLMPLAGSSIAAAAATCCLALAGDLWQWFLALGGLAAALSLGYWRLRPDERPWRRTRGWSLPTVAGALVVLAAVVWALRGLATPDVGFDARVLWVVRGAWFLQGHDHARAVLSDPAYRFAEPAFPPLLGAASAVGWVVDRLPTGTAGSFRLGQVVIGVLSGCGLLALGIGVVELSGPPEGRRAGAGGGRPPRSASAACAPIVAALVAALLCVAAAGSAGRFLTNGFADAPWVFAAAFAVVFGLVLPLDRSSVAVAAIGIAVAGQSKLEGTATAAVVVVLVTVRILSERTGPGRWRPRRANVLVGGLAGLLALAFWPVLTRLLHADQNTDTLGSRHGSVPFRLDVTAHALAGRLHLVGVAALVAVAGAVFLRRARRRRGTGNDAFLWIVVAGNLAVVGGTYVLGTTDIHLWLGVSVDRVVLCAIVLALVDLSVWTLVALRVLWPAVPATPPGCPAVPAETTAPPFSAGGPAPLDATSRGVLHQPP